MKIIIAQMVRDNVPPYRDQDGIIPNVVYSSHPRFQPGCRFNYGFLQVALGEGYNILLLQKEEKVKRHKAICEFLGIPEHRASHHSCPLWTVNKTKVEIFVEGGRERVFGGALVCGNCGYGVDLIPRNTLACPKCGCKEAERKKEQP